eukprot:193520-Hanusia_phi.AAC.1
MGGRKAGRVVYVLPARARASRVVVVGIDRRFCLRVWGLRIPCGMRDAVRVAALEAKEGQERESRRTAEDLAACKH